MGEPARRYPYLPLSSSTESFEDDMAASDVKGIEMDELALPSPTPGDEKTLMYHALPEEIESSSDQEIVIVTGADAAAHLLPLRDDEDPALTFRGMVLASVLSAFQAVMTQIYSFKPTYVAISGTFIVLIAYFLGKAWVSCMPRGDHLEARYREKHREGGLSLWVRFWKFVNPGPWGLKEHAICSITATAASNVAETVTVFTAQDLFYDLPLSPVTVILSVISVGLWGYGLCGLMRPFAVWHVEAVYWSTLPIVKSLQALHWQDVKNSKPLRYFWYAFGGMFIWEWFPAYIFPWLNSVSIPCLASMNATGNQASILTNLFGGATTNEGLGMFSLSLDWQYTTSFQTALPLKYQAHQAAGLFVCMMAMLGIYYSNTWGAQDLPFMSTQLQSDNGTAYPIDTVFNQGVLNSTALEEQGLPRLTGSFAWAMFIANAAIGALIMHVIVFWGKDILRIMKNAKQGQYDDPHHSYMASKYKDTPWYWYLGVLVVAFVLGLVVVTTQNVTLPVWAYIVALLLGAIISPFSAVLYARYGNGISTNNISKMIAGLAIPGRPIGNMYFAAFSHNTVWNSVGLCNDLKLGEYLKIPPRIMFLTQIYGTILGGFINYVVMISIVNNNRDLLVNGNGDTTWTGATIQAYNTNATSWALASYLYKAGARYAAVPLGIAVGAGLVLIHRVIVAFVPRIGKFGLDEINLPQFIQFAGYIPYNQPQTCVLLTWTIAGFYTQFYLRNYKPRIFKEYSYLVTAAWDGAALCVLFILSFAVFGAGGPSIPMPTWWGNNADGNYDHCPITD